MPSHTEEERRKNTVTTRIGQPNTGKIDNVQSDKVLEQPLVNVGGVRGRSTVRPEPETRIPGRLTSREAFKLEGPGIKPELFPEPAKKTPATRTVDRNIAGGLREITPPRPIEKVTPGGIRTKPIGDPTKLKPGESIGRFSIGRTTAEQENLRLLGRKAGKPGVFTAKGIENIFSSARDLATFFASPEFQKGQRKARGAALGAKGRRADLKLQNERIQALSGILKTTADPERRSLLQEQISKMIETTSAIGGVKRGLDTSTVEGFAATLKDLDILSDDEIRTFTNRKFAGGG